MWSVITVAKGMWPTTIKMLDSLLMTTKPGQIARIVYNDNGTPPSEDSWNQSLLWEHSAPMSLRLRIQRWTLAASLAEIWNESMKFCETDYILICNNDVVFHRLGWMDEFEQALNEPGIGLVGLIGMSWKNTPFIQGSVMALRRTTFRDVGEFDTQFEFTCEDVDFAKRVALRGLGMESFEKFRDDGTIEHQEGATRNYYKDETKHYQYLAHLSRLRFCYKWTYPDINIHD